MLRAAGSRPYGSDGKAGSIQRTAHLRELRVDILVDPYRALRRTGSIFHSSNDTPSVSPFGLPAFNSGMIATGNHNFKRFAALCNTLPGAARALRAGEQQHFFSIFFHSWMTIFSG